MLLTIRRFLTRLKDGTVELSFGREIVTEWAVNLAARSSHEGRKSPFRVLDIGVGPGTDLKNIAVALRARGIEVELYGLDSYPPSVSAANNCGINASICNIENDNFPFKSEFFDLVVANQVIEHTKEIFWIFSEISRVLKPGGQVITGVPNIASFHNRIGLLLGLQPTNIELLGPHVRGFTAGSFVRFIETDGYFVNRSVKGANFYPFPRWLARLLAKFFPKAAVSIFMLTERTSKPGLFRDVLATRFFETPFYVGRNSSASASPN